jgi:hypothetical protein
MESHNNRFSLALGLCLVACLTATAAQTTTEVRHFTVVGVDGNKVVVRGEKGVTQEITVPDDFKLTVAGKPVAVSELRPGMSGTATITTTTTVKPVYVTEIRNGQVVHVSGGSILIRGPKGYQNFTQGDIDKRGITLIRNGKPADVSQFRAGDRLSASIVTEGPPTVMTSREVQANLTAAGATMPAQMTGTTPAVASRPNSVGAATAPSAAPVSSGHELPKTASLQPLVGVFGASFLAVGAFLTGLRKYR